MASHKFDPSEVRKLENPARYQWLNPVKVADLFDLTGGETLLEYGCGTGFYTIELARRVPHGRVIALDISAELLDYFRKKLVAMECARAELITSGNGTQPAPSAPAGPAPDNIELMLAGKLPTPIPSSSIDGILAINLLHELEGEWHVLSEMNRLLAPGGKLIVLDWLAMERPAGPPVDHCLDPGRALELLEQAGFSLVEEPAGAKTDFPYHFTYILEHAGKGGSGGEVSK